MVLRRRYWLYYALQFMSGARRQIFVVFAAFMMVERYAFEVHQITALFMGTLLANMIAAPLLGLVVSRFGERLALIVEYAGLGAIFLLYAGLYVFDWGPVMAAALYVLNHLFFALALAIKTYFQKIADRGTSRRRPRWPSRSTISRRCSCPRRWATCGCPRPVSVFLLAAGMAVVSLILSCLVPRHPEPGRETVLAAGAPAPAPAE
jgi:MFS family permease